MPSFLIFEKDMAIDMGTSSTLLFEQGKGVVAREPTVVAVDKMNGKILKVGTDAQKMLGRTPANIVAIHPVSNGVISDYEMAAQMQRELVSRITSLSLFKPSPVWKSARSLTPPSRPAPARSTCWRPPWPPRWARVWTSPARRGI